MKTSSVLKLARPHLIARYAHCGRAYICNAIEDARYAEIDGPDYFDARTMDRVRGMVQSRLGVHYTLEGWLYTVHHIKPYGNDNDAQMHATRLAWLDAMIAEFEAAGD